MVKTRTARPEDRQAWAEMREKLWPTEPGGDHSRDIDAFYAGDRHNPAEVFVAATDDGKVVGFAEVSIRSHAEGCSSGRIAYLEGWFVKGDWRRRGIGAMLVKAVEAWGREQGCTEMAADAEVENRAGVEAHRAVGFEEVEQAVCFRKAL